MTQIFLGTVNNPRIGVLKSKGSDDIPTYDFAVVRLDPEEHLNDKGYVMQQKVKFRTKSHLLQFQREVTVHAMMLVLYNEIVHREVPAKDGKLGYAWDEFNETAMAYVLHPSLDENGQPIMTLEPLGVGEEEFEQEEVAQVAIPSTLAPIHTTNLFAITTEQDIHMREDRSHLVVAKVLKEYFFPEQVKLKITFLDMFTRWHMEYYFANHSVCVAFAQMPQTPTLQLLTGSIEEKWKRLGAAIKEAIKSQYQLDVQAIRNHILHGQEEWEKVKADLIERKAHGSLDALIIAYEYAVKPTQPIDDFPL